MTLHDRIMGMDVGTLSGDNSFHEGVTAAKLEAATLAAEADELMREMGNALRLAAFSDDPLIKSDARAVVTKYNNWKERNQ